MTRRFRKTLAVFLTRLFRTRDVIIVSEHRVRHLPLSVFSQVSLIMAIACLVFVSSFSFGRLVRYYSVGMEFATADENTPMLNALVRGDFSEPAERIAELESQVQALSADRNEILAAVRDTTHGKINEFESIISKTGLNGKTLAKKAAEEDDSAHQGGPFVSAEDGIEESAETATLTKDLEELMSLHRVVDKLPLGRPAANFARETSGFGTRSDPFTHSHARHEGLDFAGPSRMKVFATNAGKVIKAGPSGEYGNMVEIDHGLGLTSRYAHLSSLSVKNGDEVTTGQVIGRQGTTGRSTGEHLHYEVRLNGVALNPKRFLSASAS